MTHGDDAGLILPPRVAPYQVVVVPIYRHDDERDRVHAAVQGVVRDLTGQVRFHVDWSDHTPGWKYNEWELRGVPLRLEIGPRDIEKSQVVLARRDTREKSFVPMEGLASRVDEILKAIQQALFERALAFRKEHTSTTGSYDEFKQIMEGRPGFVISPWCGS